MMNVGICMKTRIFDYKIQILRAVESSQFSSEASIPGKQSARQTWGETQVLAWSPILEDGFLCAHKRQSRL